MTTETTKAAILELARSAGFPLVGIAPAQLPKIEEDRLASWLAAGFSATMTWLNKPGINRSDARTMLPSAQSVLMIGLPYPPELKLPEPGSDMGHIASYARGPDYHGLIKDRLKALARRIEERYPGTEARPFVDTAPINERAFAAQAGLGWVGKNACLISKGRGSFFFLGGLALSLSLEPDQPVTDHCGSCTACLDACPTAAFVSPYVLDARRCISYLTIEHRGPIAEELQPLMGSHVFGCDICQTVCPWNQSFADPEIETDFSSPLLPSQPLARLYDQAIQSFKALTRGTAAVRAGKAGLLRNIRVAMKNSRSEDLRRLAESAIDQAPGGG